MIETAMLKVFTTERFGMRSTMFQIHGGSAYFDDCPLGRMLRDARINQIGEGSNEVLTSFIALVGMRGPGMEFKEIYDTMLKPWRRVSAKLGPPDESARRGREMAEVPVKSERLRRSETIGRLIWRFNLAVNRALITYREPILDMQLVQERIANAAMELFASACVLSRWDFGITSPFRDGSSGTGNNHAADLFLRRSFRNIRQFLRTISENDDEALLATANTVLGKSDSASRNGA